MTLAEVRKLLPGFACGLGIVAKSASELKASIIEEIRSWERGENPLSPKQVKQLKSVLAMMPEVK